MSSFSFVFCGEAGRGTKCSVPTRDVVELPAANHDLRICNIKPGVGGLRRKSSLVLDEMPAAICFDNNSSVVR